MHQYLLQENKGGIMPKFVLMTKHSPKSLHDARGRRKMGKEWLQKVKETCPEVKWIAHYAILGPYDFMDIYEAPDVETAHKISLISRSEGALEAESWQAMDYTDFLGILREIQN